jgi:serine/threonine protein kinase
MTQIGEGGFGIVYKDLDLSKCTIVTYSDTSKYINLQSENIGNLNEKCVFKLFVDSKDLETEANNNLEIYKLLQTNENIENLTPLHDNIQKIRTPVDSFLVYRHFEKGDLQFYLFPTQQKEYVQKYDYSEKKLNIFKFINNALTLLSILHKKNLLHMDIKLDNFLVRNDDCIVLADYGQLTNLQDVHINYNEQFIGMEDYMPPFCHFTGIHDARTNYKQRMRHIFFTDEAASTKHPRAYHTNANVVQTICSSYPDDLTDATKFKIDLHPLGLVILQVLNKVNITDNIRQQYYDFAIELMSWGSNTDSALTALEALKKIQNGGTRAKIHILGRNRIIHIRKGREYVTYKNEFVTLNQARKKEKIMKSSSCVK